MKDYIKYLTDVLGIQNALLNERTLSQEDSSESLSSTDRAIFYHQGGEYIPAHKDHFEVVFLNITTQAKESYFVPEVYDLASKMKTAMKLRNLQVIELDCLLSDRSQLPSKLAEVCEARLVVVYSSFPQDLGELIFKGPGKWIETYSPAYLIEDPAAKKVVWSDLQKVMRELGIQ